MYAEPVYAEPAPPPRRSPGVGLWIGAAVGLVLVLVLGAFLLLSGGGGDDSPSAVLDAASSRSPAHESTSPVVDPDVVGAHLGSDDRPDRAARPTWPGWPRASAPAHAPAGVDFAGQPVTYVAPNMVDGVVETCWRTPGDATGMVLTFRLDQPTRITKVGLINGYAKTAFSGGRATTGTRATGASSPSTGSSTTARTVSQQFAETRAMQSQQRPAGDHLDGPGPDHLRLARPARARRPATTPPISEVSLVGAPS